MTFTIKKLIALALTTSTLFSGCSKDEKTTEANREPEPICILQDYSSKWFMGDREGKLITTKFKNDADNRIIIGSVDSNPMSFEYYNDKIIIKYFVFEEPYVSIDEYKLNNKGHAISMTRKMHSYKDTELKTYMELTFDYDQNDQLKAIKEGDKLVLLTYQNGNLVSVTDGIAGGSFSLTYNTDKPYKATPLFTLSPFYHIQTLINRIPQPVNQTLPWGILYAGGYLGKQVKNQITSIGSYHFEYTTDQYDKILHLKEINTQESIDSTVYNFNYLCK